MGLLSAILESKRILKDFVDITYEDQQNISRFFKLRVCVAELQEDLEEKNNELKTTEESLSEMELLDDDDDFPIQFGQVFLTYKLSVGKQILVRRNEEMVRDIAKMKEKLHTTNATINEIKSKLYHQFGSAILLEDEDEIEN